MKLIKKVKTIEVKRAFVIPQMIRKQKVESSRFSRALNYLKSNKRILETLSYKDFKKRLKNSKNIVLKLKEKQLDKIIADEYKKRLTAYNNCDWYIGEVIPSEVGVWERTGGLPLNWTDCSLSETARKVKKALENNSKLITKRTEYAISNMLRTNIHKLQDEKYLFPIIFEGDKGTRGRKRLKRKMKGDIDDGCMRSIALVISGAKKIKTYIGTEKKRKK
jgi:hypothetical protein